MNNICVYGEKIECSTERQEPTLMDLYIKLNKLEQENECLKADKFELQKENMQLRNDNQVLHNRLNENSQEENDDPSMLNEYEEQYLCGCESEAELKAMQQAYAEFV